MKIEAQNFKIEMSYDELWGTAWAVRRSIEHTIKNHWVNHQNSWLNGEKQSLSICEYMFNSLGRSDLYSDLLKYASNVFDTYNSITNK